MNLAPLVCSWNDLLIHLINDTHLLTSVTDTLITKGVEIEDQFPKLLEALKKTASQVSKLVMLPWILI